MTIRFLLLFLSSLPFSLTFASETIITFGDSITRGYPYYNDHGDGRTNGSYVPGLQSLINSIGWDATVRNYGIPGERISKNIVGNSAGEYRLEHSVLPNVTLDYVLIMEGTNDLPDGIGPSTIRNALSSMISDVRGHNKTAVIGTLLPRYDGYGGSISSTNSLIRQLAESKEVQLADLYNATNNWPANMRTDGLHPNKAGYSLMATPWFGAVKASRRDPPPVIPANKSIQIGALYLLLLD